MEDFHHYVSTCYAQQPNHEPNKRQYLIKMTKVHERGLDLVILFSEKNMIRAFAK